MPRMNTASAVRWDACRLPEGVEAQTLALRPEVENSYLQWRPAGLHLHAAGTGMGLLTASYAEAAGFPQAEAHSEAEVFLILSGTGTMLLPGEDGWQLVSMEQGTVMRIGPGVAHYFGPSLTAQVTCAVEVSVTAETKIISIA